MHCKFFITIVFKKKKMRCHFDREGSIHDSHFIFKSTMYKIAQHIQHKNNYLRRQNTTALHFWITVQNYEMLYKTTLRNNWIFQMTMAGFREYFCCINNLKIMSLKSLWEQSATSLTSKHFPFCNLVKKGNFAGARHHTL